MNIASDHTDEVHYYTRVVRLEEADPLVIPEGWHPHAGKKFQPDTASVHWRHGTEPYSAKVSGHLFKVNGKLSVNRVTQNYYLDSPSGRTLVAPEWLAELINSCKPEGN